MKKLLAIVAALGLVMAFAGQSMAAANFSISPPPIASPSFEEGKGYMKFRVSLISVEAPGFELDGFGVDFVPRKALSDKVAMDAHIGVFGMSGEIDMGGFGTMDMDMSVIAFGFNVEFQPFKSDKVSFLIFAGPAFDFSFSSIDLPGDYIDTTTIQYGLGAGVQGGVKAGDFHIDAYFTARSMAGDSDTTSSFGGSTSSTIDSYTTTSIGLDMEYTPWGLTLSSMLQEAADSGSSDGADVEIYQLGWRKDF